MFSVFFMSHQTYFFLCRASNPPEGDVSVGSNRSVCSMSLLHTSFLFITFSHISYLQKVKTFNVKAREQTTPGHFFFFVWQNHTNTPHEDD